MFVSSAFSTILPSGYTELEYIENQGDSFIDTGIITDNRLLSIDFDFQLTDSSFSGNRYLVGAGNYGGDAGGRTGFGVREGYWMNIKPGTNYNQFAPVSYDRKVCNWTIDGSTGTNTISGDLSNSATSLQHFGYNLPEQKSWRKTTIKLEYLPAKIYSVKIKLDNLVVRNLIPAKRNTDGEIGMYDTVNDVFYTNSGTGSFVAGPEINYTELEYIETSLRNAQSNDSTKIVTNYYPSSNKTRILMDVMFITGGTNTKPLSAGTYGNDLFQVAFSGYFQIYNYSNTPSPGDYKGTAGVYNYDTRYLMDYDKNIFKINNTTVKTFTAKSVTVSSAPLVLMQHPNTGANSNIRIYSCKVYEEDELLLDLVPVKRNYDDAFGLYNKITNEFLPIVLSGSNSVATGGPEIGIIGDTCTYATIMGENICLIDTQPSGSYLPVKYNNNKYYLMLDATHDYPIHKNSDNKLKVIVGNTTYNAHDTSVLE